MRKTARTGSTRDRVGRFNGASRGNGGEKSRQGNEVGWLVSGDEESNEIGNCPLQGITRSRFPRKTG